MSELDQIELRAWSLTTRGRYYVCKGPLEIVTRDQLKPPIWLQLSASETTILANNKVYHAYMTLNGAKNAILQVAASKAASPYSTHAELANVFRSLVDLDISPPHALTSKLRQLCIERMDDLESKLEAADADLQLVVSLSDA